MATNDDKKVENTEVPMSRRSDVKAAKTVEPSHPTRASKAGISTSKETASQPVQNIMTDKTNKQETNASIGAKTENMSDPDMTKEMPSRATTSKDSENGRSAKKDAKNNKKKAGKVATGGRSFMLTLMAIYFIVVGIIGAWGVSQFFWFYIQEKSPVMAAGTENSRVEERPDFESAKMAAAHDAIMAQGFPIKSVTITQVGPTIHFLYVVNDEVSIPDARWIGQESLKAFATAVEKPDAFNVYEAQIILTKENLAPLDPGVMLRPAGDPGWEQAFPQFGVSNKNINHSDNPEEIHYYISWSRNGE